MDKNGLGNGRKSQERKAQKNMAYDSEEKANDEWVERGLAVADRVCWRSKASGLTLHTEKWKN